MAIETKKIANMFWPIFISRVFTLIIVWQILLSLGLAILLIYVANISIYSSIFWIIISAFSITNTAVAILFFKYVSRPTKYLLGATLQISGETSSIKPPDLNSKWNEKTGLKDALMTIYEISSKDNNISNSNGAADQSNLIRDALNTTKCGFIVLDENHKIVFSNKPAPTHNNKDNETILDLIFNGSDTLENWLKDCEENEVRKEHLWTRIPDKLPNQENRRFFDVFASYQKGNKNSTVLILVDKTDQYIVDEENLDFIAFAAHELRGPITVIRGYLDVLGDELEPVLRGDQGELFRRLVVCSNRLSGYINNILNTSRYDRRHLKMSLVEDTVQNVYDEIKDDMQLRAVLQNRALIVEFPKSLPTIAADRASLGEVLGNLIDNAIKYSSEGGIINVTAKALGEFVEIAVQDHGIGMPQSVVSQLFQKFYRSHRSRETVAGTGIGLYISKAIVESHGGTISVHSEENRGTTFVVSIPIYSTVADKLKAGDNSNEGLISQGRGWIKNHSMYRG